jgi:uncharacterized protein (TIGR04551 family)
MLRPLALALAGLLVAVPSVATAQPRRRPTPPPPQQPTPPAEEEEEPEAPPAEGEGEGEDGAEGEGTEGEGGEGQGGAGMQLRAPMLEGASGEGEGPDGGGEGQEGEGGEGQGPGLSPTDAENRLLQQGDGTDAEGGEDGPLGPWASKSLPLFNMHGYFRTRFELFHQFHLGWKYGSDGVPDPINTSLFPRPIESGVRECGEGGDRESDRCQNNTLAGANLRLRMNPQINVSDEVQVNVQLDLLDNLVLGSTPEGYDPTSTAVSPWAPIRAFTSTQVPPDSRNSLSDALTVRRAWAQVRTDLGVLRFGRMASEWGLGMLANGGDGLHSDYGDIADRVMFATRIAGITIVPIWDFAAEGPTSRLQYDHAGQAYDVSQLDDVNQYILVLARKLDEEDLRDRLQLGQVAIQGGLYLVYRDQLLTTEYGEPLGSPPTSVVRRNAQAWIPDVWLQVQYRKLRVEMEAVLVAGTIENLETAGGYDEDNMDVLQYGGVAQIDYRLMNDKLRIGFETGIASGDADVEGISANSGLLAQLTDDRTVSAFRFDRDFNVDLILWEEMFSAVSSAYYFRPNISYDFINSSLGQLFGARLDIVYSRAMFPVQTRGNSADLGVEFDLELYYRSEDGPSLLDGFQAGLRYGILIPLGGLGPQDNEPSLDLSSPQTLQAFLGVVY